MRMLRNLGIGAIVLGLEGIFYGVYFSIATQVVVGAVIVAAFAIPTFIILMCLRNMPGLVTTA